MEKNLFPKSARLSGKKNIDLLFNLGKSKIYFPFRILSLSAPESKVMFSVPFRNFRKATDRNKLKRLMREAWRINRQLLRLEQPMIIAYIYTSKEILPSRMISQKMIQSFRFLRVANEKS